MPKLDTKEIKKNSILVFYNKDTMLKYLKSASFRDSTATIRYLHNKWLVRWDKNE